jgi:hypothetical protein
MPITPFMGVRISWLMLARNCDFACIRELGALLGLSSSAVGRFEIPRALRHLLAEHTGQTPEALDPQPVPAPRREDDASTPRARRAS